LTKSGKNKLYFGHCLVILRILHRRKIKVYYVTVKYLYSHSRVSAKN
jgi:hypothetical protein